MTPEGAIGESAEIVEWVDTRTPEAQRLLPADPADRRESDAFCRRLDDVLGRRGRRLMYVHMFTAPQVALGYNNAGVPRWEDRAIRRGWPVAVRFVERALGIRPGIEAEDEVAVFAELDHVAEVLADGRPFLSGERFGAADLTFASLCASVLCPPVYGVPLPQPDALPAGFRPIVERAREHPAGRHALRMYATERLSDGHQAQAH